MKKIYLLIISCCLFLLAVQTAALPQPGRITQKNNQLFYTIKPNDTFYKLSKKLNTSPTKLQQLNPNQAPRNLRIGSQIKIKTDHPQYTVQPGDTLWEISQQYSVPLSTIIKTNLMAKPDLIFPREIILLPKMIQTTLYFPKFTQTSAHLVAEKRKIPVTPNPYTAALKELIDGPTKTKQTYIPLPKTTKVKEVTVKNNIAYVNFGPQITQANVGSAGEHLLLLALANTLTEFKKINGVKILVKGKKVETIGGHIVLNKPLRRSLTLVKEKK